MTEYKHRHREVYQGVTIDIRANTSAELSAKLERKKKLINKQTISPKMKLSAFGELYISTYKENVVSDSWVKGLRSILHGTIIASMGDKQMDKIRPLQIQRMLNGCSHLSESYIKKVYDFTCQLWHTAYKNGVTYTDYAEDLQRPHGRPPASGRSLTDQEREVLLKVLDGHRGELFCKLMLYCGLRPGEVHALQWKDIDLNNRILYVTKARKKDMAIGSPKSAAGVRQVPVPLHFVPFLQEHRSDPFDYIAPQTDQWRRDMWSNVKRMMNIEMGCRVERNKLIEPYPLQEPFNIYFLRHTYCTDLEKAGVPINIASRLMGHSDISITSKIYTHASEEALDIARDMIDGKNDGQNLPRMLKNTHSA